MKLKVSRNKVKGSALFLGMAMLLCGCQRDEFASMKYAQSDAVVRFAPSIAAMSGDDGLTRATLHNTTGDNTHKLSEYLTEFQVAAWEGTSGNTPFIPAGTKVEYITAGEDGADSYWSTVDGSGNIKEYKWKKTDATKTFFAWANLPASGASVECTSAASQTLTITDLPTESEKQTDILLGLYQGDGSTGSPAKKTGTASIHFYHPLTAVQFKKGTLSDGVRISGISIEGVYTSGKTTQTPSTGTAFAWTKTDGSAFAATDETGTVSLSGVTVDEDGFIGDAIVLIPQTFTSNSKTRIKVVLNDGSSDIPLYYPLTSGSWAAGHTYVLTIGYEMYEYSFELADPGQATQEFTNTTSESPAITIPITSTKPGASGETDEEWRIQSYRIGSGAPVDVRSTSFTGGGLEVSKSGDNLTVKAQTRTTTYGSHDYWVNSMKRTDKLDRSPAAWSGVTDLSRLDFKNEIRNAHPMTTANCYVIRHAGTYKLPLVYGNAVVDGAVNEQSYFPNITAGSNRLERFENHLGAGITSAFIENNTGCTASSAAIVWQDKAKVIRDVQIVSGASAGTPGSYTASSVRYLQFTVDETTVCQNNAIIAVKDGSGNIIWSWHIWTTNDPALLSAPIAVTNNTNVEYDFFPLYNLGWIDANYLERETVTITLEQTYSGETVTVTVSQPSVADAGCGCWYQFGRKDPMCTVDEPADGSFTRNGGNNDGAGVSLATAICNPDKFYTQIDTEPVGNHDWCTQYYHNLWTGKKSDTESDQDGDMIKTIYDPSPVGYKMPAPKAFTGFTTTGNKSENTAEFNVEGEFANGWNFYTKPGKAGNTVFFPAAGYRYCGYGKVFSLGESGFYWSAVPSENTGHIFNFSSELVDPMVISYRASGFAVRPVLEPGATTAGAVIEDYNGHSL